MPLVAPVVAGAGADGADPDPLATPFTSGAVEGVTRGPLGPVLALRGAGLGADILILWSCTARQERTSQYRELRQPVLCEDNKMKFVRRVIDLQGVVDAIRRFTRFSAFG
ncbi:hypothetical protein A1O7_05064 [Cladophialophora yegresii CBS 114405]|uniref:Uncharacterized protein n=1 Tax=Cladophialophora yegresii CBS 114405 TaxID=1182544 RepID=W9W8Q6_9EURO|nr:uncharacterized protein A1O7_05064 [Cladophialophora yegresii CBS 114405]EXJ60911.1 hypothetical protein A1O7_05064 [Cladophialophora yegresii CBS 114405]